MSFPRRLKKRKNKNIGGTSIVPWDVSVWANGDNRGEISDCVPDAPIKGVSASSWGLMTCNWFKRDTLDSIFAIDDRGCHLDRKKFISHENAKLRSGRRGLSRRGGDVPLTCHNKRKPATCIYFAPYNGSQAVIWADGSQRLPSLPPPNRPILLSPLRLHQN